MGGVSGNTGKNTAGTMIKKKTVAFAPVGES